MDVGESWKRFLLDWPDAVNKAGILITHLGEAITFAEFICGETMVIAMRRAPDTMGARQIIVPYAHISALKMTDVLNDQSLEGLGFARKTPAS